MREPLSDAEAFDATLPPWLTDALRAPIDPASTRAGKARVMAEVRRAPRHRYRLRAVAPRWARRGVFAPLAGMLLAAGVVAVAVLEPRTGGPLPYAAAAPDVATRVASGVAIVLRDTVVPHVSGMGARVGARVLDTLRIVRVALRAPDAMRVTLAGDFNAWSRSATPLTRRDETGEWEGAVLVPRHAAPRYAVYVDGRRVDAPAPALAPTAGDSI